MLNVATQSNLERKARWADRVQIHEGIPMPSWTDLSITDLCNRSAGSPKACVFCPRIDSTVYPNQKLHMAIPLAQKIGQELRDLNYEGAVVLCGFGEPLLHPNIIELIRHFQNLRVEIVTNGDRLTSTFIRELSDAGTSYFLVSMYDGPEQVDKFRTMFDEADCEDYALRDRWHGADEDFGLKLTNRAGTIDVGHQPEVDTSRPCWYPDYCMTIDWDGRVLLCPQDWNKSVAYGNVSHQTLWEIWTSPAMHKRRMRLLKGRSEAPCSSCNACGTLHGAGHVEAWTA